MTRAMFSILALAALMGLLTSAGATEEVRSEDARAEANAAVPTALRYLEQKALAWKDTMGCASCHHAPMMLWASEVAKARGFAVDEEAAVTIRNFILDEDDDARLFPPADAPPERDGTQIASIYALLALSAGAGGWENATLVKRTQAHFTTMQLDDGSWPPFPSTGRPPILEGNGASARLLVAMLAGLPPEAMTAETAATVERARAWLAQPLVGPSHQIEVFQYLAERVTGASPAILERRLASLRAQQREDGSWAQTPALAGDALATGQTLFALGNAGMRLDDPDVARAIHFLARTQQPDGAWPMVSRPVAGGATEDTIAGTGPIQCMAAGWAVLGLLAVL